jgi:hypothetical protein
MKRGWNASSIGAARAGFCALAYTDRACDAGAAVYNAVYSYGILMRFLVLCLRHRGRPLPKRDWSNRTPVAGDLRVEQLYDGELLRHVRIARLVNLSRTVDPDDVPSLYDPTLIAMSPQAFTLAGFERIEGTDYAQSWLVTPG